MTRRRALPVQLKRFTVALMLVAIAGAALLLLRPAMSGLYLFTLYAMPSNSMMPFPHEPGLLFFAKYYDPILVAIAGTIGSGVVAFADYELVERMFRLPRVSRARESKLYKWSIKWFMRAPFWTSVAFSFTPLPIYIVRVLAPAAGYSVYRYVLAIMIGRLPRFYLVALLGHKMQLPTWLLVVIFFALIALVMLTTRGTTNAEAIAPVTGEFPIQPDPGANGDPPPAESEIADELAEIPHTKPTAS